MLLPKSSAAAAAKTRVVNLFQTFSGFSRVIQEVQRGWSRWAMINFIGKLSGSVRLQNKRDS